MTRDHKIEPSPKPQENLFAAGSPAQALFHRAWSLDVGTEGYDKSAWMRIERRLFEAAKEFAK